jgi:low affinity Fe/Cu permease
MSLHKTSNFISSWSSKPSHFYLAEGAVVCIAILEKFFKTTEQKY